MSSRDSSRPAPNELQPQLLLLSLDTIALLSCCRTVLGLLLRSLQLQTFVDFILDAVAATGGLVHEAVRVTFLEGGDDLGACCRSKELAMLTHGTSGERRWRLTQGILGVQVRMHND